MLRKYKTVIPLSLGSIVCLQCGKYCESHNKKDKICLKCYVSVVPVETIDPFLISHCLGKIGVLIYNEDGELVYAVGRFAHKIKMFDLQYLSLIHI